MSFRWIDPRSVVSFDHDGAMTYRAPNYGAHSTPWTMTYTSAWPMTTRYLTRRYRVYLPDGEDPCPFILVRGQRFYLTLDFAQKVMS